MKILKYSGHSQVRAFLQDSDPAATLNVIHPQKLKICHDYFKTLINDDESASQENGGEKGGKIIKNLNNLRGNSDNSDEVEMLRKQLIARDNEISILVSLSIFLSFFLSFFLSVRVGVCLSHIYIYMHLWGSN